MAKISLTSDLVPELILKDGKHKGSLTAIDNLIKGICYKLLLPKTWEVVRETSDKGLGGTKG